MAKKKVIQDERKTQVVSSKEARVPIKWNIPDTIHSVYASNVLVQLMENEFRLSFFETKPPIRLNETDPLVREVRADCVASVILHPKKVLSLINALKQQLKLFAEREQKQQQKLDAGRPTEPEQAS